MLVDTKTADTSVLEREAILAGCRAATAASVRARGYGVLEIFVGVQPVAHAEPKLEALRAYAELRHVLSPRGHSIASGSLLAAGYDADQIAGFDRLIMACR